MTTSAIDHEVVPDDSITTPVKRKSMLEMALNKQIELVEKLRERRFALKTFVQKARSKNSTTKFETLHGKCEIKINQLATALIRIDASIEKADGNINAIRVMLLEMGEFITKDGD